LCAALLVAATPVLAAGPYVKEIVVTGNRQVSSDKILRVIRIAPGSPYEVGKLQEALKRLFATKQFQYVQAYKEDTASPDSVRVVVRVDEYPKVENIRYEGNKHIDEDDLNEVVTVTAGTFIRPAMLNKDREVIADLYKEKGYYRVAVNDSIVSDPETRGLVLLYVVEEGQKVSVKHIDFIGVRGVDSEELRKRMQTKKDSWLRGGDFKPKEFEDDKSNILTFYRSRGYLDAEIKDTEMVFSDDGKGLDLFITVEEGRQYKVGDVTWGGNELFPDETISTMISMYRGCTGGCVRRHRVCHDPGEHLVVVCGQRVHLRDRQSPKVDRPQHGRRQI